MQPLRACSGTHLRQNSPLRFRGRRRLKLRAWSQLALQGVADDAIVRALTAWTQLFGLVSFELFGHFVGVVEDSEALFDQAVTDMCAFVGIASAKGGRRTRSPRS